jgi:hypothetical protein
MNSTAAAPAGVSPSASASPAPSGSATPADGPSAGQAAQTVDNRGCAAGGPAVPKSANRARTGDLDGDGAADSIWLAIDGNDRVLGVSTASGARFSTVFSSDARSTASAVAGRLASGAAIVLLDFPDAEAKLYAVIGCAVVPSLNVQGQQYTFDRLGTHGTGAGCLTIQGKGKVLMGYQATPGGYGDGYNVTGTIIKLSKKGARADNGATSTVGEGRPEDDAIVKRAKSVACGKSGRALEPAG